MASPAPTYEQFVAALEISPAAATYLESAIAAAQAGDRARAVGALASIDVQSWIAIHRRMGHPLAQLVLTPFADSFWGPAAAAAEAVGAHHTAGT